MLRHKRARSAADVGAMYTKPMVECSVELYHRVCQELLPTPTRSHYTFNLRDVSKVFQGITSIRAATSLEPRRCGGQHCSHGGHLQHMSNRLLALMAHYNGQTFN
jgi:hypothetical protein